MSKKFAAYPPDKASTSGQGWGLAREKQEKDVRYVRKPRSRGAFDEEEVVVEMDMDVDMYVWGKQSSAETHSSVTVGCCITPLGVPDENFPVNVPGPVEVGSDCDVGIEF